MTVTEFLKDHVPFLSGLTQEQAHALAVAAQQRRYAKGKTVLFQGESVDGLHVIAEGKVSVHARPDKGKEPVRVAEMGPGDVFGETSIVEFTLASATIKSEEDTLIFVLPEEAFRQVLEAHPELKERTTALIEERRRKKA